MKKIYMMALALATILPAFAQETYENAKVAGPQDLNGTARYVGMGGAMEALGADLSTISSNPAGIGLFRKSSASVSLGVVSQQDAVDFSQGNKTNMSFDQLGFVYSMQTGSSSFMNFAFNYHKSRNFDFILSAADGLRNASQNKLTYAKAKCGLLYEVDSHGVPNINKPYASCTQLDDIYARNVNYDVDQNMWFYDEASAYQLDRAHKGYISNYDFNFSGNLGDRVYLGFNLGFKDLRYHHYGLYQERLNDYDIAVDDEREIKGQGFDMTVGAIFRPIEYSPFRIGVSIASPTFYDMTTSNYTVVNGVDASESYDFKLFTPWKFGLSLGHTVGNMLALGASYEYADYGHLDTRFNTGESYDYWSGYTEDSESDEVMNAHTKATLKGVSTFKIGAELKPCPELAMRLGYNYQTPTYREDGFKDSSLGTEGSYYSSATDYTNWKATNRITAGLGYAIGNLNLDVAYQYSCTNGDFYPFMSYRDNDYAADDNIASAVKVSNKRHQLLFTIGYRF
jgi:hypothetical protein